MRFWYTVLTAGGRKLRRCVDAAEPTERSLCAALARQRRELRHLALTVGDRQCDGFYEVLGFMLHRPLNRAASQLLTQSMRSRNPSFAKSRGRLTVRGDFIFTDRKILQDC